jgi:hypothetical protein
MLLYPNHKTIDVRAFLSVVKDHSEPSVPITLVR